MAFSLDLLEKRPGLIVFKAVGQATKCFSEESGGHRWQRRPPNDRHGRTHTSTITVAVMPEPTNAQLVLRDQDLEFIICRGSGAGGQHRNVTDSAVTVKHKPTGIMAKSEGERSQHQNKAEALAVLKARLWDMQQNASHAASAASRREQIGSGQRGDKRRTIRAQDGQVHDHKTGRRWSYNDYVSGRW